VHEPPNPRRAGACGWHGSQPVILVGARIARNVPCEPRELTVSHARDTSMRRNPGILKRAYTKTVKLNPAISTQERGVENPPAAPPGPEHTHARVARRLNKHLSGSMLNFNIHNFLKKLVCSCVYVYR
jgi:hypothetical protein